MHEKAVEAALSVSFDDWLGQKNPRNALIARREIAAFLRAVEPSEGMERAWDEAPLGIKGGPRCSRDWRAMANQLADELEGK